MVTIFAFIIAFIGAFDDTSRFEVCKNTDIEQVAHEQGYTVYEDCSFTLGS